MKICNNNEKKMKMFDAIFDDFSNFKVDGDGVELDFLLSGFGNPKE